MNRSRAALALFTFLFLFNGRHRAVQHPSAWPFAGAPADIYSFAEPAHVTTRHLTLDLTVDFEAEQLRGRATLELENRTGARMLVLDTYELDINQVILDGHTTAVWSLGEETRIGQPLRIEIEPTTRFVTIDYATDPLGATIPDSIGPILNWNPPQNTFGGEAPFVYSLSAPIGARSWIPLQDTPTVRASYEATLRVPRGLLALMSAADNPTSANDTGVYVFHMPYRIPSYLIAFAVGRLEFHAFDERTGAYAEPELIDDVAWELQYLPEMVDVAETIAGPFPFLRHDVLLMPPTFTVEGMEHPMLNFVQPLSTVSGDQPANPQPRNLIAHELAHSWAGDATTLANWNDVWLNEGFATYLAHRIMEEMRGAEQEELAWFTDHDGYRDYADRAEPFDTKLHRAVPDPTDGFDVTGYVKGALFLRTLEDRAGRPVFDAFLQRYFASARWWWVDDQKFLSMFRSSVPSSDDFLLDSWVYEPGLPSNVTAPTTSAIHARAQQRATLFSAGTPIAGLSPASWTDSETTLFLQFASADVRMRMAEVDAALSLSARATPPQRWLLDSISARYAPGVAAAERVLRRGAPYSWIASLYSRMKSFDAPRAEAIFQESRDLYFPLLEQQVARILGVPNNVRVRPAA